MFRLLSVYVEYGVLSLNKMFDYALCDAGIKAEEGFRVVVDFNNRKIIGFIGEKPKEIEGTLEEYNKSTGRRIKEIDSVLDEEPILNEELLDLAKEASAYYLCPVIEMLKSMLPPSLRPNSVSLKKPKKSFVFYYELQEDKLNENNYDRNEKALIEKFKAHDGILRKNEITSPVSLAKLEHKGVVIFHEEENYRLPQIEESSKGLQELNAEQKQAFDSIVNSSKPVSLLEGVTGSGKTEIYIALVRKMEEEGKGSIVLVPEISLTDALIARMKSIFKDKVALFHSGLTDSEKYDEYRRLSYGQADVVIGTRSAIFAPVKNLGLIIIDEEHSESYKQDVKPFYDARTIAQMRIRMNPSSLLVFGSATPLIEHRARAERGYFNLVKLVHRYNDVKLPEVRIIDMTDFENIDLHSTLISIPLREKLKEVLEKKEQAILLLNRRGYSPVYTCRKCQKPLKCPECDIPLTYHKRENLLLCHHCGYSLSVMNLECPHCGGKDFIYNGFGTERVMEELKELFPGIRVVKFDADSTRTKGNYHKILTDFSLGKYDVMIGTQMVAKGHDFPSVSFACALMADASLNFPSYKADEDTFDLLTQLVGRAGRREQGYAYIQTYSPDNEVIRFATKQDYEGFYHYELDHRKEWHYPPYCSLLLLTVSSKNLEHCEQAVLRLKNYLSVQLQNHMNENWKLGIYGPSKPYVAKLNGRYERRLMLKIQHRERMEKMLEELTMFDFGTSDIKLAIDVDPSSDL